MIKEIRERIQFLVTIYIFFSTIVYGFYKSIGSNELLSNSNSLVMGIGVILCIINYLIVSNIEEHNESLKWIKNLISINLMVFIIPITVFIITPQKELPGYYEWPFKISLWSTFWLPVVICVVILFCSSRQFFKEIKSYLKR